LEKACQPGGTGFPFFEFDLSTFGAAYQGERNHVACKTGTAQFLNDNDTHAWFSVFAPAKDPEIEMTFLVEAGGEGSKDAAPLALEAMKYWFGRKGKN
jgi:cell division protein FtsI/penicillin-binding protein 2